MEVFSVGRDPIFFPQIFLVRVVYAMFSLAAEMDDTLDGICCRKVCFIVYIDE